jgi:hypothetical protein
MPKFISVGGEWKEVLPKVEVKKEVKEETVTDQVEVITQDLSLDITGDGKVDEEDASLAGKVLQSVKKKPGRKPKI